MSSAVSASASAGLLDATTLVQPLLNSVDGMTTELVGRILSAEHGYLETTLLTPEQLHDACHANLSSMIGCLASGTDPDLASAQATGRLKAEQGVPLAALLHAFRLGGRLIWEELMDRSGGEPTRALLQLAAEVWALVDVCSDAATESYRSTVDALTEETAESRRRLVRALFGDHVSNPGPAADAVRAFRIPERGHFLVVSADSRGVETSVPDVGAVWDSEVDGVLGLLYSRSEAELDAAVAAVDVGGSIGISTVFSSPSGTAAAAAQARLARTCARVDNTAMTRYDSVPVEVVVASHPDSSAIACRQILGPLLSLPTPERNELLRTLDAWFSAKGSTSDAAAQLHYHRNTVLYRLRRIGDLTGRHFLHPADASELYLGLRAYQLGDFGHDAP